MPAHGPPRLRGSPTLRGSAAPEQAGPWALLASPLPTLRRSPQPRSPGAFPTVPSPCIFTGGQKSTAERATPAPPGAEVSRASSQTFRGAKSTCGPRGSPQFPRPGHPAAPAAARTKPGALLLHGRLFLAERAAAAPGAAGAAAVPRGAAAAAPQGPGSSARSAPGGCSRASARWRAASATRGEVFPPASQVAFY